MTSLPNIQDSRTFYQFVQFLVVLFSYVNSPCNINIMASIKYQTKLLYQPSILQLLQKHRNSQYKIPLSAIQSTSKPSFYQQFLTIEKYQTLFIKYLEFLANQSKGKKINFNKLPDFDMHEAFLENKLAREIHLMMSQQQLKFELESVNILKTKVIDEKFFHGVLIHRDLNMGENCYSFENDERTNTIKYRIRNKLSRSDDVSKFNERIKIFNEGGYYHFYKDSFENFIKKEAVKRSIVLVEASIQGKIVRGYDKKMVEFIEGGKSTEHLMQVESIVLKNYPDQPIITDMDFFMKGNPYIV